MRNLFTRAFLFFWATIVVFAVTAALVATINFVADSAEPKRLAREAQVVLDAGGRPALERWLGISNARLRSTGQRVLILDEQGRDILGQPRPRFAPGAGPGPPDAGRLGPGGPLPPDVMLFPRLTTQGGSRYVLVMDPPPSRGPLSPPFSRTALVVLLLVALAVSGLVSYAFARSISRPLERLQATARRLADGNLSARTDHRDAARPDEIGGLSREFDAMASRLAALVDARRQLLRDMSHELRSPLARLQMAVGIARQPGAEPALQLERIERESERLEALIARILEYARLERDPSTLAREDVDLVELARQVVHDAEFEAQAPAGRISLSVDAAAMSGWARLPHADPAVLHTAVDNVVRNALLHGGEGPIEVSVSIEAGEVTIAVRDHGPGVPPVDLGRIFEPFYRVASEGRPVTGHGVGLALARQAAALHGGRVTAENAEGGGLDVRIVIPLARPRPGHA